MERTNRFVGIPWIDRNLHIDVSKLPTYEADLRCTLFLERRVPNTAIDYCVEQKNEYKLAPFKDSPAMKAIQTENNEKYTAFTERYKKWCPESEGGVSCYKLDFSRSLKNLQIAGVSKPFSLGRLQHVNDNGSYAYTLGGCFKPPRNALINLDENVHDLDQSKSHPRLCAYLLEIASKDISSFNPKERDVIRGHLKAITDYIDNQPATFEAVRTAYWDPENGDNKLENKDIKLLFNMLAYGGELESWRRAHESGAIMKHLYNQEEKIWEFTQVGTKASLKFLETDGYFHHCSQVDDYIKALQFLRARVYLMNPELAKLPVMKQKKKGGAGLQARMLGYVLQTLEGVATHHAMTFCLGKKWIKMPEVMWMWDGFAARFSCDLPTNEMINSINEDIAESFGRDSLFAVFESKPASMDPNFKLDEFKTACGESSYLWPESPDEDGDEDVQLESAIHQYKEKIHELQVEETRYERITLKEQKGGKFKNCFPASNEEIAMLVKEFPVDSVKQDMYDCKRGYQPLKKLFERFTNKYLDAYVEKVTHNGTFHVDGPKPRNKVMEGFENLYYYEVVALQQLDEEFKLHLRPVKFITQYFADAKVVRYQTMNFYPDGYRGPERASDVLNLWRPYRFEGVKVRRNAELIEPFHTLIKSLISEPQEETWLLDSIAMMLQHPEKKQMRYPVVCGPKGVGKSSLFETIHALVGSHQAVICTDAAHIFGEKNSTLEEYNVLICDDIDSSTFGKISADGSCNDGRVKSILTSNYIQIRKLYKNPFQALSFHYFIFGCNHPNDVPVGNGERRFMPIKAKLRTDNEGGSLFGNIDFFANYKDNLLPNEDFVAALYGFFMDRKVEHFKASVEISTTFFKTLQNGKSNYSAIFTKWLQAALKKHVSPGGSESSYPVNSFESYRDKDGVEIFKKMEIHACGDNYIRIGAETYAILAREYMRQTNCDLFIVKNLEGMKRYVDDETTKIYRDPNRGYIDTLEIRID